MNQLKEGIQIAESSEANAELELPKARKTVQDLSSIIQESNSQVTKIERLDNQKRLKDGLGLFQKKTGDGQFAQVTMELENLKQELSKLKLNMDYAMEVKTNAETEIEASSAMILQYSAFAEVIRKNVNQLNEEHVLVAVARLEALSEYTAIEAERNKQAEKYMIVLGKIRKKVNDLNEEAASIENEVAATTAHVNRLKSEITIIKEMDTRTPENAKLQEVAFSEQDSIFILQKILEESEAANKEIAAINEEGFQLMCSMDVIREELKQLAKEKAKLRKMDDKTELTIQSVNSKLLRAKSRLEALSFAEEKANSMSSSLAGTLKHLREEAKAAKKERALDLEETAMVKAEVLRTKSEIDLDEAKLQASTEELRAVKLTEAKALKTLAGISVKARATSQHNSKITVSTFEYDYLKRHAVDAKKVADKKVEAAQAWTEALRSSEKEMLMVTQQKIRVIETINFGRKHEQSLETEQAQSEVASSRKRVNRYSILTPGRQARFRKSGSVAGFYMARSSITIDRRRKGVQNISKFFSSKDDKRDE